MRKGPFIIFGFVFSVGIMLAFQNCGEGFSSVDQSKSLVKSDISSQCTAKMLNDRLDLLIMRNDISCTDLKAIECDVSTFSPEVENSHFIESDCSSFGSTCIQIHRYFFNTKDASQRSLPLGDEYNRMEIRCSLFDKSPDGKNQNALLTEQGNSLSEAVHHLIETCTERILSVGK